MIDTLPWQTEPWRRLAAARAAGRMPHALLVCGPAGVGKGRFAGDLSAALLCAAPDPAGRACGHCRSCELLAAATHPDLQVVTPAEDSNYILIDQIRALGDFVQLTSQQGGHKVAVVTPADALNANAANALLKGLEEPPARTVMVLISDRPGRLPATVRSRCQRLLLAAPPAAGALAWLTGQGVAADQAALCLSLAQGAPLRALELARDGGGADRRALFADFEGVIQGGRDPVTVAEAWLKADVGQALYWLYTWLVDMVRLGAVAAPPQLGNADLRHELTQLAQKVDMKAVYSRMDQLHEARFALDSSLNKQLMLEDLLLAWAPRGTSRGRRVA